MNKLQIKNSIKLIVTLSLILNSSPGVFAMGRNGTPSLPPETTHDFTEFHQLSDQAAVALSEEPSAREQLLILNSAINSFENNQPLPPRNDNYDIFHLTQQRLEIPRRSAINVSELSLDSTTIPFSNLRIEYSVDRKELSFIATQGENELGQYGIEMGRQIISNLDIAGFAHDNEILSIIDHKGNLSIIDMGYVATELGRNPIPVFKNVWQAPKGIDLSGKKVTVRYLNRGATPLSKIIFNDPSIVIPRNAYGEPEFKAGDLIVTYQEKGEEKYLGVFSRQVSHAQIIRGSYLLEIQAALADPEFQKVEQLHKLFKEFDTLEELNSEELQSDRMNLEVRSALMSITPRQIKALNQRRADHNEYQNKTTDQFTLNEWIKSFEALQKRAKEQISNSSEQERLALELKFSDQNLWKNWSELVPAVERTNPIPTKIHKQINLKYVSKALLSAGAAYLLYPFVHDPIAVQNNIQFLNVFYENSYPGVLKDATYRIPLILSMSSLVALWPIGEGISMVFGKAIRTFDKALQNNSSRFAGYIRDIKKHWSDLTVWQRINSFGMRVYANFIYPVWVWIPKYILRQPSLISALQNELNPLTKIDPKSDLGKLLDLKTTERLGINNPFLNKEALQRKTEIKQKIQASMQVQKKRTESLAWLLGSMIASEEYGTDLATILMMEHHDVTPEHLNKLLTDPKLRKEWYVAADLIYQQLWDLKIVGISQDLTELDPSQIQKAYEITTNISKKMKSSSNMRKTMTELKMRFKKALSKKSSFILNLGVEDANFLRTVYTNKFVSGQVQKEFVPDHLMVIGIYGMYGERADLKHPEHLTANMDNLLWTTPPHLYDVAINTYAHFFVAGARMALVHQSFKAQEAKEYQPIENFEYKSDERQEGLISGVKNWIWDTMRPWKSDIGGIGIRRLYRSFTTIQAFVLQNLLFRMVLGQQTFDHASKGAGMWFAQGQWRYGWPWDFIQAGNKLEEERIEEGLNIDRTLRLELSRALKETDNDKRITLIKSAYENMFLAYEKSNPQALKQIENLLSKKNEATILKRYREIEQLRSETTDIEEKSQNYFGLLAKLSIAITTNNTEDIDKIRNLLAIALAKESSELQQDQDEIRNELLKLNAQGLLDFSLTNPPHYTNAHPWVSWLAAWTGAISTTVMAISLSVDSFTPELLNWSYIGKWFLISSGLYTAYYLLLGKDPWLYYFKKIDQWKTYWIQKSEEKKTGRNETLRQEIILDKRKTKTQSKLPAICKNLFK